MMLTIDRQTALASLQSELCPACGNAKQVRHSLCARDYFALPTSLRRSLYDGISHGYEAALADALDTLGIRTPHWPEATTR